MPEKVAEEMAEGMQCTNHPYRNNPGGICAFCLQEKLGKLVSSSKSSDPFLSIPTSPSSSPPPFPSQDFPSSTRISFLSAKTRRRKPKTESFPDTTNSPRKKSFWSFLTLSSTSSAAPIPTSFITKRRSTSFASDLPNVGKEDESSAGNDDASPSGSHASSSFGRKVARSRSVGCGSRSFSGDFLERISNGFGDCALRRVESHREAKQKSEDEEERVKERIKCGRIFVGFGMTAYWLSADACGESVRLPAGRRGGGGNGRSKSWGWAFASPMRAFRPGGGGGQSNIIASGGGGGRVHRR